MSHQMKLSVEGETVEQYVDWQDKTVTEVRTVLTDGRVSTNRLDAGQILAEVARLVPEGTRLRVTVETIEP